jgi:GWxTD domain-containing protein
MKKASCVVTLVAVILWPSATAISQVESGRLIDEEAAPYAVDAISFSSLKSQLSRLDVFTQVPYEHLSFVKRDGKYQASYEMTIDVLDSTGKLVDEKSWTEEVEAATFDESESSQFYSLTQRSFEVIPARYSIVTTLRDNETKNASRLSRQITVSDYATSPFMLSDIMLVAKVTTKGERTIVVPSVSRNVGRLADAFHIFFEAYNNQKLDSVRFVMDIVNDKRENQLESTEMKALAPGRNQVFLKIETSKLALGEHTLYVRAFPVGPAVDPKAPSLASTSRTFVMRWQGIPQSVKDIDEAIDQIQYIAKEGELSYIKDGATPEERQKRFMEFWKKRDPNPNTPRNEKMEQYYAKVEYANKHFAHYTVGWRTDMGMVYIIFGPPSNIDRHPFDRDSKPYEVWAYYDLNYQFVFVDETGFGDYRLITPITDVWQRAKN